MVVPWASAPKASGPTIFSANAGTLGAIPDSNVASPICQNNSTTQLDVTFTVSGMTGTTSAVQVAFNAAHTFLQDLEVTLIAPGGSASMLLFSATGTTSTVANTCAGSSSDLTSANTYTFADSAAANWWTTAATNPVPTSSNRTVVSGIGGTSNPPAVTSLSAAFAGVAANGTWTLRFRDRGAGDTGSVTAASLTLTTGAVSAQHVLDNDGDGTTDWVVVRNTGGGPTGQVTWFSQNSAAAGSSIIPWGIATDFFVPGTYDADTKFDVAVWRPGAAGSSYWFILNSATSTLTAVSWGQSGDDPTVQGDYNADNQTDIAVYRPGPASGNPSYWYSLQNGAFNVSQWGQNGDFPAPGDYDGDHKSDFVVQRNAGGGQARFWMMMATGATSSVVFGTPTDVIVPGDYDGDGKTDVATIRGVSGQINWYYLPSSGGSYVQVPFGLSASDFPTQGDYDGDGKTDIAVWRPNADPTLCFFYVLKSSTGTVQIFKWGQNGDYPVANYNSH